MVQKINLSQYELITGEQKTEIKQFIKFINQFYENYKTNPKAASDKLELKYHITCKDLISLDIPESMLTAESKNIYKKILLLGRLLDSVKRNFNSYNKWCTINKITTLYSNPNLLILNVYYPSEAVPQSIVINTMNNSEFYNGLIQLSKMLQKKWINNIQFYDSRIPVKSYGIEQLTQDLNTLYKTLKINKLYINDICIFYNSLNKMPSTLKKTIKNKKQKDIKDTEEI